MNIEWQVASPSDWQADALLFFGFENTFETRLPGFSRWLGERAPWIEDSVALKDFRGKVDQSAVFYTPSDPAGIARVVCVGLGAPDKLDPEVWRNGVANGVRKCRELRLKQIALPLCALDGLPLESAPLAELVREAVVGALLGLYGYNDLKTKDRENLAYPETLLLLSERDPDEGLRSAVSEAQAIVSGVGLARDLTSAPANLATPTFLLNTAGELADRYGFHLRAIGLEEAETLGMGAFAAVARGSKEPAYMLVLESVPPGSENDRPITLVGKGITFDTGGISIKPAQKMEAMKHDMAGAAAILGVFEALGRMGNGVGRVAGVLPCTENMPGGQAYKPGDVLKTLSGQTVEVISTDAEGRLVLADAITYAVRFLEPSTIVDIATLTGACIIALGPRFAAVMGNRETLTREIQATGMKAGERFWPLPLPDFYFEMLKSDVADFKNVGTREAGTIVAGLFLKQFIPKDVPWAHLDIAGAAWTDKDFPATPKGATGFGVRTLLDLVRRQPSDAL